jgi:hypothetical protein
MTGFPRRGTASRLFVSLALCLSAVASTPQTNPAREIRLSETLAPGIEHLEIRRGDFTDDLERGCVEAINLDGGGSTTMVISNRVVNNPSDATGERPVSDALLVFPRK